MVTRSKLWQDMIAPHCSKFKMAAMLGDGYRLNKEGCMAYAQMLSDMAQKLDLAHDALEDLSKRRVTMEGNNVS